MTDREGRIQSALRANDIPANWRELANVDLPGDASGWPYPAPRGGAELANVDLPGDASGWPYPAPRGGAELDVPD